MPTLSGNQLTKRKFLSKEFRLQIAENMIGKKQPKPPFCLWKYNTPCKGANLIPTGKDSRGHRIQRDCVICHRYYETRRKVTLVCSQCGKPFCNISNSADPTCYQRHLSDEHVRCYYCFLRLIEEYIISP